MSKDTVTLLVLVIGALGGFGGAASLVQSLRGRGKDRADEEQVKATATQVLTDAAAKAVETGTGLLGPLQAQITWLVQRDEEREKELVTLRERDRRRERELRERDDMALDHMEYDRDQAAKTDAMGKKLAGQELTPAEDAAMRRELGPPPPLIPGPRVA